MNLIVVFPFGPYTRGQRITDAAQVEIILLGENAGHVRKVPVETEPEAPAAPEPAERLDTPADAAVDTHTEPAA